MACPYRNFAPNILQNNAIVEQAPCNLKKVERIQHYYYLTPYTIYVKCYHEGRPTQKDAETR